MRFSRIEPTDRDSLWELQPPDWPDIVTDFEIYLKWPFCYPLKVTIGNKIAGIGTSIVFEKTGWLAHIIVHPEFRNRGLGFAIVEELLKHQKSRQVSVSSLVATKLGYPVYVKAGFKPVGEYVFYKRDKDWPRYPVSEYIIPYNDQYRKSILKLDQNITGENREKLLNSYLTTSRLFVINNKVEGYYIPELKEGPIYAIHETAGIELMKVKYAKADRAVIPSENKAGIVFLEQNGFIKSETTGTRMLLGEDISWQPEMVYSRIGGNFG